VRSQFEMEAGLATEAFVN